MPQARPNSVNRTVAIGSFLVVTGVAGFFTVADDLRHVGELLGAGSVFLVGLLLVMAGSVKSVRGHVSLLGLAVGIGIGALAGAAVGSMAAGVVGGSLVGILIAGVAHLWRGGHEDRRALPAGSAAAPANGSSPTQDAARPRG